MGTRAVTQTAMAKQADDDLYAGFNNPINITTEDLAEDEGFQQAVRTSYGSRPPMTGRTGATARMGTSAGVRNTLFPLCV
ncbi:unnamed protein product [Notodromas monacha]|uniref:Uncharacterized protein n=1 Tax=Notodromas monacha TaxID=399045 RepID=A0A7R9GMK9_9CRUS|nr:unnamed protein product [Notodromas monacha]CAG0926191.1 unnamed protein product [Notodromas monacha]